MLGTVLGGIDPLGAGDADSDAVGGSEAKTGELEGVGGSDETLLAGWAGLPHAPTIIPPTRSRTTLDLMYERSQEAR